MSELKRHPHADVLIAIAEGREVQFQSSPPICVDRWVDFDCDYHAWPGVNHGLVWRVKPKKQKRWVNLYQGDGMIGWAHSSKEDADEGGRISSRIACIEIEFEEGEGLDGR